MTDHELDKELRHILLDALEEESRETDGEAAFTPSAHYRRSVDAMLRDPNRWAQRRQKPLWRRVAARAAIVLLTLSVAIGGLTATSPAVRAQMKRWAAYWQGDSISYRYAGDDLEGELPVYVLTGLPDGYVEDGEQSVHWDTMVDLFYRNEADPENDVILFDYLYMQDGTAQAIVLDEGDRCEEVCVNGLTGKVYLPSDPERWGLIEWIDPETNLHFMIHARADREELLRLAESVKPADEVSGADAQP